MATSECVVLTLQRRREGTKASQLPVELEQLTTTRQNFVGVCLMANIPNNTIIGSVEDVMQGHGDFDSTETRSQMPGINRHLLNNIITKLSAHFWQVLHFQFAQVTWIFYLVKQYLMVFFSHFSPYLINFCKVTN